jgi:hypothetical protein
MRFDYTLLDPEDPFEIDDGNRPHLNKHLPTNAKGVLIPVGIGDILDMYHYGIPRFYEGYDDGDADWLMLGEIPGGMIICVPVASPQSEDYARRRPIGLFPAVTRMRERYLTELGWMS